MRADFERYRFAKQFLVAPQDLPALRQSPLFAHWKALRFGRGHHVFHHPALAVAGATHGDNAVLCLGELLDPQHPQFGNDDIARALATTTVGDEDFERRLARLGGRWVVLAQLGTRGWLYHDAGGLKSVFRFLDPETGDACIGSQPVLFEHLFGIRKNAEREAEIRASGVDQWPLNVQPYDSVAQLPPNHRIDLDEYSIDRYWPRAPLASRPADEAAADIMDCMHGIMQAALARGRCSISLTAGYDSRLLLAAAGDLRDQIAFFTLRYNTIPRFDVVIPQQLVRIAGIRHSLVPVTDCRPELRELLSANCSDMFLHESAAEVETLAVFVGGGLYLQGTLGEQMRCLYYKSGAHPALTPEELGRYARFPDHPGVIRACAQWLRDFPQTSNVDPLEVFYWEHRTGVWGSAGTVFREALLETAPPMNCRWLLEQGLSVDVAQRKAPHALFRSMYAMANRRLLKPPFNTTRLDALIDGTIGLDRLSSLPFLWRVKHALRPAYYGRNA